MIPKIQRKLSYEMYSSSLLTMPPQGQTQGLSYKDQDQDLGGKDKDKD